METDTSKSTPVNLSDPNSNRSYANVLSQSSAPVSNNNISMSPITNGNEDDLARSHAENSANSSSGSSYVPSENSEDTDDSQLSFNSAISKDVTSNLNQTNLSTTVTLDMNESSSAEANYSMENSESDEDVLEEFFPDFLKFKLRNLDDIKDLPETCSVLETSDGSKLFLVGTAHFSLESQADVSKVIRAVQPDCVIIELCKSRINVLDLDEATIMKEAKDMNFSKIKQTIEQNGFLQGALYFLMMSMSVHLTKQLGMAPGGEFRRAYTEARQVPGCVVQLGDRPIHITLQRALAKLSWWQKLRIGYTMLHKGNITKEEVERCKQKDMLEDMLAALTGEYPEVSEVFVRERDIYLTYSLQMAATSIPPISANGVTTPACVVGVVGIGHVKGIKEHWGKVRDEDIPPILHVPEPSLSSRIVRQGIRLSFLGLGLYGAYKLLPNRLKLCFGNFKLF